MARPDSHTFLSSLFGLEGKTAVVIGGTGVLCGALAKGFWQAGCRIVLVGRDRDKAEAHFREWGSGPEEAGFFRADVTEAEEIQAIVPAALDRFGRIDIWVNGAGVNSATPYLDIDEEEFGRIVDANLKAVHLGCQTIGGHWIRSGQGGSIINLGSMSALRPLSRVFTYSLTKAAVLNLTRNLAREWAPKGIRVNALCPGFFPAEQNRKILDRDRVEAIMGLTPLARFGEKEELVGAALLLASDAAGSFITGSNLVVDGGFSVTSI